MNENIVINETDEAITISETDNDYIVDTETDVIVVDIETDTILFEENIEVERVIDPSVKYKSVEMQENVVKGKPVTVDGYLADSDNPLHNGRLLGIASENANTGFACNVQYLGLLPGLVSLTKGSPLFVSGTTLSHIAPVVGWVQRVGEATETTEMKIEISLSIKL